ncbi:MAG: PP2C family protein-serine/threonine phosphatase [Candidatus Babeliales bacterium]|nr:PP2C family protein-serine/threonine phosphatase [Candidatus Babeliales bacterium]
MKKVFFLILYIFVSPIFGAHISQEEEIISDLSKAKGFFQNKNPKWKLHQSYEGLIELYKKSNSSKHLKTKILDILSRAWAEGGEASLDPFIAMFLEDNDFSQSAIKEQRLKLENNHVNYISINIEYGMAQHQGERPYQEDRYDMQIKDKNIKYFAVFDGHGGYRVAQYAKENLYTKFLNKLEKEVDIKTSLATIIEEFNSELPEKLGEDVAELQGSTAVVAVIQDDKITVANVGDSRAVLSRNGQAVALSVDHKPNNPREKTRIIKKAKEGVYNEYDDKTIYVCLLISGTGIRDKSCRHVLAVSRSLGDTKFAPYVISEPEIIEHEISPEDEFIILASDGIWDVITSQNAVDLVNNQLSKNMNLNDIAKYLISVALRAGSKDNLTVIIIKLPDESKTDLSNEIAC